MPQELAADRTAGEASTGHAEFRVLGRLEITRAGREVRLPGQHVHWLLAVLLLSDGSPVSEDQLLHLVWGPSGTSLRALRTTISRLRSWMRGHAGAAHAIEHVRSGGYLFEVPGERLDAARFMSLYRASGREPDPDAGLGLTLRALKEWRGVVLEGAPESIRAHPAIGRLERARTACASRAADLALRAHRPEAALRQVRDLAAGTPFDEPLQARLIRLLAATGRRAEGLRHFAQVRHRLADELGVDPSDELRAAHALLLQEPPRPDTGAPSPPRAGTRALASARGTTTGCDSGVPVAAELPMDVRTFTGRAREVENLCSLLSVPRGDGSAIASISGCSGVGKSALAIHVAHRIAELYPDGQLYVNLGGSTPNVRPLAPAAALGRMLRSLGLDGQAVPVETEEAAAKLRSLVAGRRLLIVLDNALDAAQVRDLLPGDRDGAVLITSRRILTELDGVTHVRLDLPPEEESLSLFAGLVGRHRVRAEPDAAEDVVSRCGRLPLAVCIAAARLNARLTWSVRTLADRLSVDRHRLGELRAGDRAVRASFAVGYDELDADEARMFRRLGLLATPDVDVAVAAALAQVEERTAEDLLDRLVDLHMVENHAPGRYGMHDLLRQFAHDRALREEPPHERERAVREVAHWYLATARTACLHLNPDAAWRTECEPRHLDTAGRKLETNQQVHAWVEEEAASFATVLRQAVAALEDGPSLVVALAAALYLPMGYQRLWREQLALCELAVDAAARTGDPLHHAISHGDLGDVRSHLERLSDAITQLRDSLETYRRIGHARGQATQLDRLAGALGLLGRFEESIDCYLQALELDRRQGDRFNQGMTLSNLGIAFQQAGRHDEAIRAHGEAIEIHREAEDPFGLGSLLGNLAEAWRLKGEPERAAGLYKEALQADADARRTGTYDEAEHWWGLSRCYDDLGEPEQARKARRTCGAILHDLGLITAAEMRGMDAERRPPTPEIIRRNT
ncbi:AfsR/SARP family transcriptional regulator [Nonomuraea sp. NPDC050536]|uniref:AfsR/SARP family transcriptional regulator n=1 Tax=Nonomuraea sp. NPDC050536 TaxID=3364366 RepID=UPI0037C5F9D3